MTFYLEDQTGCAHVCPSHSSPEIFLPAGSMYSISSPLPCLPVLRVSPLHQRYEDGGGGGREGGANVIWARLLASTLANRSKPLSPNTFLMNNKDYIFASHLPDPRVPQIIGSVSGKDRDMIYCLWMGAFSPPALQPKPWTDPENITSLLLIPNFSYLKYK